MRPDMDDYVRYNGNSRPELRGLIGRVTRFSGNDSIGVTYPDAGYNEWERYASFDGIVWAAAWAWEVVEIPDWEKELYGMNVAQSVEPNPIMDRIDSEILKLKNRIAELEDAKKVLESL